MFKRFRSSRTGRYVTPESADANRDTTTAETTGHRQTLGLELAREGDRVVVTVIRNRIATGTFEDETFQQALARLGRVLDANRGRP